MEYEKGGKMVESKKEWSEPELIVLVRNKPEESVLATCKLSSGGGTGPVGYNIACKGYDASCTQCPVVSSS
jgi:hypothetical protein